MFRAFILLCALPIAAHAQIRAGDITPDGHAGDWLGQPALVSDGVLDVRGRPGFFDIRNVFFAADSEAVVLMLQTREPPSLDGKAVAYGFAIECDADKSTWDYEVLVSGDGRAPAAWSLWALPAGGRPPKARGSFGAAAGIGEVVEIRVPTHLLGGKLVYPVTVAARVWDVAGGVYADDAPDAGGVAVAAAGEEALRPFRAGQGVRPAKIVIDGRREDWGDSEPVGRDAAGDATVRDSSLDLIALHAATDDDHLVLMLECGSPPSASGKGAYWFTLHGRGGPWNDVQIGVWGDGREMKLYHRWVFDPDGGPAKGGPVEGIVTAVGEVLEMKIPLSVLGGPPVYPMHIGAMSALAGKNEPADLLPDAPPHVGVELSAPPSDAPPPKPTRTVRRLPEADGNNQRPTNNNQ